MFSKTVPKVNSRPVVENSPNLVNLMQIELTRADVLWLSED
jgi:hypothetical protein